LKQLKIDNQFYDELGRSWYEAQDNPVALLRAEAQWRNPWVIQTLKTHFAPRPLSSIHVLDIAAGAGFLSNELARVGMQVTGVDLSAESLLVAQAHDSTQSVRYEIADALALPFEPASFDAVCLMDFLEHVESPNTAIAEATRVIKPGGLLFFHTFNRNWLSWLIVIKGVEWFVKNTPARMHLLELFIKPEELRRYLAMHDLKILELFGSRPKIGSKAFLELLLHREVPADFKFVKSSSLLLGYTGVALKSYGVS
jgi:2-polyprenyl-6-hydroxyphenyl methylase/3-demethylubiquinone-9 3-methyltransferase